MKEKAEIAKVYNEILWLLINSYVYIHIQKGGFVNKIGEMSRYDLGDFLLAHRSIFENLVLRICRLDDDSPGVWSFYEARKRLFKEERDEELKKAISKEMKKFRDLINPIKTKIRNNGIAHALVNEKERLEIFDIIPVLSSICQIGDLLAGKKKHYTYTCGSNEKIDLREFFNI